MLIFILKNYTWTHSADLACMLKTFVLNASAPAAVLLCSIPSLLQHTSWHAVTSWHVNTVSGVIFNVNATPTAAASTSLAIRLPALLSVLPSLPPARPHLPLCS